MMSKEVAESTSIIKFLSASDHQVQHDKRQPYRRGFLELDTQNAILAQNKLIYKRMDELKKHMTKKQVGATIIDTSQPVLRCDFCAGDHPNGQFSTIELIQEEHANFMSDSCKLENFNFHHNSNWRNNQYHNYGWRQEAGNQQRKN